MAHNLVDAICCGDVKLAWNILVRGTYGNIDSLPANRPGTALFCCCTRGYLTLAAQLLEHGADVECKDENLATPLHGAVDNGHLELVRLLLSHRADVNAQTRRGDTALHLAAYRGFPYISQCLVVAGADLTVKNTKFMTPDMEARGQGHVSVARYLQAALEVVHPGEDKRTKCRSDSLTYLDPPTFFSSPENNDQDMESLWQLDANQQTHVLQSGTLPTQPKVAQNALLWEPQPRQAEVEAAVTLNQVRNSPSPSRHQQANQGTGHRLACSVCAKKPLKEQHFNVLGDNKCRDRADFEQMLEMNVSPPVSAQYGRQPEQNDENCGDRLDNTHICSFQNQPQQYRQSQHQLRQHGSQQKQIIHHHPCHDHHIQSHHQFNTHTTHIPTDVHGQQREPHHPQYVTPKAPLNQYYQPQIPMSFLPFTQHGQYQFQPNADSNPSTWTQTKDVMNLKPTVSTPNQTSPYDSNTNSQNAVTLRPEILQYNDLLLEAQPVPGFSVDKMFAPVKSTTSPHSGSGSRPDDETGSMVLNNLSHRESLVLSEDGEDTSFNSGGSSQDSSSFSTLSSLHSLSLKHHVPNKVLRSKSLTYQTELSGNFSEDDKRGVNTINTRGQRSERRQKSLSHFVPSGPPLLTSGYGSLEVQHPSLFSLDSLHSGSMRCGTPSSLTDTKRCSPPKRLSRSASSSPSVTVEDSSSKLPQIIQQTAEDTAPGLKQQGTYLRSGQTNLCGRVPNETHSGNLCRRCSIDEDVLKSKANNIDRTTIDCCRRFSVAGTNSVNSLGNIIDSSISPSSISGNSISGSSSISDSSRNSSNSSRSSTSNSSGTSGEIRGVCRNPSYESAYGSSNNSLGSSVFDSCGYVPSFNSYSDSATDLSCDKESWQNSHLVTPVTIDKPSSGALDRDQTIPKSAPSVPRVATRCTSLPTYILNDTTIKGEKTFNQSTALSRSSNNIDTNKSKTGRDTDRNVEKISNVLSQLNDLSLTSTEQHHSLASPGSLLFDKHQSLPPLTFINIPTN